MSSYSFMSYGTEALSYDPHTGQMSLSQDYRHGEDRVRIDIEEKNHGRFFDGDQKKDEQGDDQTQEGKVYDSDGNLIDEGKIYAEEVYVIEAPDGHRIEITRVEIGGNHVGYMTTEPLEKGVDYDYIGTYNVYSDQGSDHVRPNNPKHGDTRQEYSEFRDVPCFGTGTRIDTPSGPRPVEMLRPGDVVLTRDFGVLPVLRADRREIAPAERLSAEAAPIRIPAGCFGPGRPARALYLSPQHRVTVEGATLTLDHGVERAFVPARAIDGWRGARQVPAGPGLCWHHILLPVHAEIRAEGLWCESLLAAPDGAPAPRPALPCLSVAEGRALLRVGRGAARRARSAGATRLEA